MVEDRALPRRVPRDELGKDSEAITQLIAWLRENCETAQIDFAHDASPRELCSSLRGVAEVCFMRMTPSARVEARKTVQEGLEALQKRLETEAITIS